MPTIEIDFDVFKALTTRRDTEATTYNDVIRDLLKLPAVRETQDLPDAGERPWVVSDTSFPAGSKFLVRYKGEEITGIVRDGMLELTGGQRFPTPSAAACHVTGGNVNGWRFWRCKLPGTSEYVLIERLRGKSH
ncbi:MAG: hypothetical protein WD044_16980 [Dongiaceae bacterium]